MTEADMLKRFCSSGGSGFAFKFSVFLEPLKTLLRTAMCLDCTCAGPLLVLRMGEGLPFSALCIETSFPALTISGPRRRSCSEGGTSLHTCLATLIPLIAPSALRSNSDAVSVCGPLHHLGAVFANSMWRILCWRKIVSNSSLRATCEADHIAHSTHQTPHPCVGKTRKKSSTGTNPLSPQRKVSVTVCADGKPRTCHVKAQHLRHMRLLKVFPTKLIEDGHPCGLCPWKCRQSPSFASCHATRA